MSNLTIKKEKFLQLPEEDFSFDELQPTKEELIEIEETEDDTEGEKVPDSVRLYLNEIGKFLRLTSEEEVELAKIIEKPALLRKELLVEPSLERRERIERKIERAEIKSAAARTRFANANLKLVAHYAYGYMDRGVPFLDLVQEGNLGLLRAVEKFDWRIGFKFSTYATWWIKQALRRAMHTQERAIRLPVHANNDLANISRSEGELSQELKRLPTESEVSERTGLTSHRIAHLKAITKPIAAIDERLDGRGTDGDVTYADTISDDEHLRTEELSELEVMRLGLLGGIETLAVREALVTILRNGLISGHPLTLAQTGEQIGVSREMARQIEIKAMTKLKEDKNLFMLNQSIKGADTE